MFRRAYGADVRERGRAHRRRAITVLAVVAALAGCGGDDDTAAPTTTVVPTTAAPTTEAPPTTTTVPPTTVTALEADPSLTPEQQVEAAYLRSWEVFADALATGDPSALDTVYAEGALESQSTFVLELTADGLIGQVDIDHNYSVALLDETTGVVVDTITNRSVLVDPTTGDPTEEPSNSVTTFSHTLRLSDGTWRVTRIQQP